MMGKNVIVVSSVIPPPPPFYGLIYTRVFKPFLKTYYAFLRLSDAAYE
jgi:hypothetical protein